MATTELGTLPVYLRVGETSETHIGDVVLVGEPDGNGGMSVVPATSIEIAGLLRAAADEIERPPARDCARCGHSGDVHALDDALDMSPTDPAAPFRCHGPELLGEGALRGCAQGCPDFVAPEGD